MHGIRRRNGVMAAGLLGLAALMVGLSFAAIPLYDLFCRVTGFGGTPRVAEDFADSTAERWVTVRFNADVHRDLNWEFRPAVTSMKIKVGEAGETHFVAKNLGRVPIVGTATYNVTPEKAGPYFNKVQCFCFTRQILEPGQEVVMPVTFFVDPTIVDDRHADDIRTITLSYTFFKAADQGLDGAQRKDYQESAQAPAPSPAPAASADLN